jgi:competence protein ComEA
MQRPGGLLLVLVLSLVLLATWSRRIFPSGEVAPVFSWAPRETAIAVALGEGFERRGIHHFSDGVTPRDVINLTSRRFPGEGKVAGELERPLRSGELLVLRRCAEGDCSELGRSFLPASQRMLLGIPLDPASMNRRDWEALPGIGPKLAEAIEKDRQKNDEFASLEDLQRVKGVGKGKLAEWRSYFDPAGSRRQVSEK